MPGDHRTQPGDPHSWMQIAKEDLALAKAQVPGVGYGLLCYHAQQAVEKALKAVLVLKSTPFPYVHDIGVLLQLIMRAGDEVPPQIIEADTLTDYATIGRYPGAIEIEPADHDRAVALAEAVFEWAEEQIEPR
jgi:HEPN domain-containing protein